MDCRYLNSFVAVAESGSFSEASRRLRIAQPALSRQIRLLEDSIKATLFIRSVKGVALSEAGERILPHAQAIVAQIAAIPEIAKSESSRVSGRVVIGIPTTASAVLSKPLLDAAGSALPEVQLHLVESMSGYLTAWLENGTLDFSILYDPEPNAELTFEDLLVEELALVGTAARLAGIERVRFQDLGCYPLVLPGPSHALRRQLEAEAARRHHRLNVVIEIDSLSIMKAEILGGSYFSVLAPAAVGAELSSGALRSVPLVDPTISRTVTLARSSTRTQTRASRAVADLARQVAQQLRKSGVWKSLPCREAVPPL